MVCALKPGYARTRSRFRDGTPSGRRSCVARGADKRGRLSGCRNRFSQDFQSRRRQEAPTPTRPLGVAQAAVAAQDVGFWGEQTFAPDGFIRSGPRNVLSLGGALACVLKEIAPMSSFELTRRAALVSFVALAGSPAVAARKALAKLGPFGGIRVDVAPLLANSLEPTAGWVAHMPHGKKAASKTPMDAYVDGCRATWISTAHPTRTSRRSSSRRTSPPVNASGSRRHSKP